ncbi:MAG TPA: hypothetical protein VNR38_06265 [Ureibacillus sp.]|nr:hypothetical protein [Ureibacillus sp.]
MAVANYKRTNMVLVFRDQDDEGKLVTKKVTLSDVRNDLTENEFFQFAEALGRLTIHSFSHAERVRYDEING